MWEAGCHVCFHLIESVKSGICDGFKMSLTEFVHFFTDTKLFRNLFVFPEPKDRKASFPFNSPQTNLTNRRCLKSMVHLNPLNRMSKSRVLCHTANTRAHASKIAEVWRPSIRFAGPQDDGRFRALADPLWRGDIARESAIEREVL